MLWSSVSPAAAAAATTAISLTRRLVTGVTGRVPNPSRPVRCAKLHTSGVQRSLPESYGVPENVLNFHSVPPHIRAAVRDHFARNRATGPGAGAERRRYEGYEPLLHAIRPFTCRIESRNTFANREYVISSGSGFVCRSDGLIATSTNVTGNLPTCRIVLDDGSVHRGTVEWRNERIHLAVVRIDATGLPVLPMSSSKNNQVVAITGVPDKEHMPPDPVTKKAPFFPTGSVRGTMDWLDQMNFRTPGSIVYGHTGGPVVNRMAEACGVAHITPTREPEAIPIELLQFFLMKRETEGDVPSLTYYPRLAGLLLFDQTLALFKEFDLPYARFGGEAGVVVAQAAAGSPAFESGIRTGDLITAANGSAVKSAARLVDLLTNTMQVRLRVQRRHESFDADLPYDKWPVHDDRDWRE